MDSIDRFRHSSSLSLALTIAIVCLIELNPTSSLAFVSASTKTATRHSHSSKVHQVDQNNHQLYVIEGQNVVNQANSNSINLQRHHWIDGKLVLQHPLVSQQIHPFFYNQNQFIQQTPILGTYYQTNRAYVSGFGEPILVRHTASQDWTVNKSSGAISINQVGLKSKPKNANGKTNHGQKLARVPSKSGRKSKPKSSQQKRPNKSGNSRVDQIKGKQASRKLGSAKTWNNNSVKGRVSSQLHGIKTNSNLTTSYKKISLKNNNKNLKSNETINIHSRKSSRIGNYIPDIVQSERILVDGDKTNLVCYYGSWAVYRPGDGKFNVENIDPFLCTHIIYGFTGLSYDNQIKALDPWNDLEDNYGKGAFKRFTNLKRINPELKALIAIGGWNEGSVKYSKMASDAKKRAIFIKSVVNFLGKYNFDGLDLDWEYPGSRGGVSEDKANFLHLLKEMKRAFAPHNYLLTAAVSAGKSTMDGAYHVREVAEQLDFINLMAYDYHGGWETFTGHNAPLFSSSKHDKGDSSRLNVAWSVKYWLDQGAPANKIMLGTASYGRSFTLNKASDNGFNAPANQAGQAGPYTREPGSLGYNEICANFKSHGNQWTKVWDKDYQAPYAYNDRLWVGFDDLESISIKAQYARSMGLGGVMMWSIETDDFTGNCHGEKFPLLNRIKRVMNGKVSGGSTTTTSTTTTTTTTTTLPPVTSPKTTPTPSTPVMQSSTTPSTTTTFSTTQAPSTSTTIDISSTKQPIVSSSTSISTTKTTSTTPDPTTASTQTAITSSSTTTQQPSESTQEYECKADGMFVDANNCRKFYRCVSLGTNYMKYVFDCPPNTAFNEERKYCDHLYNVPACKGMKTQPTASVSVSENTAK